MFKIASQKPCDAHASVQFQTEMGLLAREVDSFRALCKIASFYSIKCGCDRPGSLCRAKPVDSPTLQCRAWVDATPLGVFGPRRKTARVSAAKLRLPFGASIAHILAPEPASGHVMSLTCDVISEPLHNRKVRKSQIFDSKTPARGELGSK